MIKISREALAKSYEVELKELVRKNTPKEVIQNPIIQLLEKDEFSFTLNKSVIENNKLEAWLDNYRREASVSTAGIRGPQNILFPWDTRFPINLIGVLLATYAKGRVLQRKIKDRVIRKLVSSEVRYNSKMYVELIARVQAALGIHTLVPKDYSLIPIWMASYLIFKLGLEGGEYVTSSHAVSTKTATKDLNEEGSQFLPEQSLEFVEEIDKLFRKAMKEDVKIKLSAADNALITSEELEKIGNGVDYYVEYLRKGVANEHNLDLIRSQKPNLIVECVGGCMYPTTSSIFKKLGIDYVYRFFNTEHDPFFAGIGKTHTNPKTGSDEYFDLSCDISILDVAKTLDYEEKLKDEPVGTTVLMTDPDGDRLIIGQLEPKEKVSFLKRAGVAFIEIGSDKVFTIFTPNQSYLMTMDFHLKSLNELGTMQKYPRFIIKTTASTSSWDEWAKSKGIPVVNVPVGFKEIANIIHRVEKQISQQQSVSIIDITGKKLNLKENPRLLFAGEESGGMITGAEEMIESLKGKKAMAMREKSAGEAMVIISAMAAKLKKEGISLSQYLENIFEENKINARYDVRVDITYYNESNPDPKALQREKKEGEKLRDLNDRFFVSLALGRRLGKLTLQDVQESLQEALPELDFSDLQEITFVGDGSYMLFAKKFVEIRKSGTDAKTRAYSSGIDKDECVKYAQACGNFPGNFPKKLEMKLGRDFIESAQKKGREIYMEFLRMAA